MGPDYNFARKQGEEAFIEISKLLNEKYHIDPTKKETFGIYRDEINQNFEALRKLLIKMWEDDATNSF